MQPGAATNLCRCGVGLAMALLPACAASRYEPGKLNDEQLRKCRALEASYRANAPEYQAQRDDLAQDPVAVAWLVRMFVRDLFVVREGRPLADDDELLRAAARIEDPIEQRAMAEIRHLGALAVPTLIGDLLRHEQPQPRELGIELLAQVGSPAKAPLQEVASTGESRHRRAAARALGRIGIDGPVLATLRQLSTDEDYTVRADALRSLPGGGEPAQGLLIERLQGDADPFVRRVAAQSLGHFSTPTAALVLVDYLERCQRERDWPGERAAQASLQRLAGTRGTRLPRAWRAWAVQLGTEKPSIPPAPVGR